MERMSLERFVVMQESQVVAARLIGVKPNALNNWLRRTPGKYEVLVSRGTDGRDRVLKVMREVKL